MLQSPRLKDHVKTIDIDQSLINNDPFENKCLQNTKKLYNNAGKCDDKKQLKNILEVAMVSTTEVLTDNSPIYPMKATLVKKPSARKLLCLFNNILNVKKKTAIC